MMLLFGANKRERWAEAAPYALPLCLRARVRLRTHLAFLFLIALFGAFALLPLHDAQGAALRVLSTVLCLALIGLWVPVIRRVGWLEVTDREIRVHTALGEKSAGWREVEEIRVFETRYNTGIGLRLRGWEEKPAGRKVARLLLDGNFDLTVNFAQFADVRPERLFATVLGEWKAAAGDAAGMEREEC